MIEKWKELFESDEKRLEITTRWDPYNSHLLTAKLYRHVEKGEIDFQLRAKEGSVEIDLIVGYLLGVSQNMTWELIKYVWKRMRKQRHKDFDPVIIKLKVGDKTIFTLEITGDEEEPPRPDYIG